MTVEELNAGIDKSEEDLKTAGIKPALNFITPQG